MTGHLISSLARRSIETYHEHGPKDPKEVLAKLPGWNIAVLAVTLVSFVLFASSIEYTIRLVIAHLAMVESPGEAVVTKIYTPVSDIDALDKKDSDGLLDIEVETVTPIKPLTTSIRKTIKHIQSVGGRTAKWRGLGVFVLYVFLTNLLSVPLSALLRFLPRPAGAIVADVAASIVTARLHTAWTHKVMSMPSTKSLLERLVTRAQWKKLIVPTALSIGAQSAGLCGISMTFRLCANAVTMLHQQGNAPKWVLPIIAIIPGSIVAITIGLFMMLPAYVSLVRLEASMLHEEDNTIVPFDSTFGGRVLEIGGSATLRQAWQSFGWPARRNLVKLYVKFAFIMAAMVFIFSQILALELYVMAGDEIKEYARTAHSEMRRSLSV